MYPFGSATSFQGIINTPITSSAGLSGAMAGQRHAIVQDFAHAIAVERGQREHLVAGRDAGDARADFLDHSGQFVGRDRRQTVDRPFQLAAGDRRRVHADKRLRQTGSWPVGLLDRELRWTARRTQPDDAHHESPS